MFPKQINISSRNNLLLVFAMIDIDKFKDYNDTYGHQEGDNTLIKVAKVLSQTMKRSSDYAFRIGGEEFGLLFNTKDEKDALKIVDNIKQKVENLKIEHSKNKASKYVTISIGVKIINPDCKATVEELYASADKALYEAKETGRNNIVFLDK
jgi:diguanylate cyclase (GGDEF)-like protein